MGRKQKSAEEREHERSALAPRRQAARTQHTQSKMSALSHILQHRGGRAVGVAGWRRGRYIGRFISPPTEKSTSRSASRRSDQMARSCGRCLRARRRAAPRRPETSAPRSASRCPHLGVKRYCPTVPDAPSTRRRAPRTKSRAASSFFRPYTPSRDHFCHCSRPCAAFSSAVRVFAHIRSPRWHRLKQLE